jgi:hypothetical protein
MPYQRKNRLGTARARLRDLYPGLAFIKNRHNPKIAYVYYRPPNKASAIKLPNPFEVSAKMFKAHYDAARAGTPMPADADVEPQRRSRAGTWNAACDDFEQLTFFTGLAPNTQRAYVPWIEVIREMWGDLPMRKMDRWPVFKFHNQVIETRGKVQANTLASVLGHVIHVGRLHGWVKDELMLGIEHQESNSVSYRPYKEEEIALWREKYGMETMARKAFELGYRLMLSRADLILLAPCHIADDGTVWINRRKTGGAQISNIHDDTLLEAIIASFPPPLADDPVDMHGRSTMPFLRNANNGPFLSNTFGKQWRRWATAIGLPEDFTIHGSRATGVTEMEDLGVRVEDGMKRTGHREAKTYLGVYAKQANKVLSARRAQQALTAARQRREHGSKEPDLRVVA